MRDWNRKFGLYKFATQKYLQTKTLSGETTFFVKNVVRSKKISLFLEKSSLHKFWRRIIWCNICIVPYKQNIWCGQFKWLGRTVLCILNPFQLVKYYYWWANNHCREKSRLEKNIKIWRNTKPCREEMCRTANNWSVINFPRICVQLFTIFYSVLYSNKQKLFLLYIRKWSVNVDLNGGDNIQTVSVLFSNMHSFTFWT